MPYKTQLLGNYRSKEQCVIEHLSRISAENMKPFSIKIIIFIIVHAMGRCIAYYILFVITYVKYLASDNSLVIVKASSRKWNPVYTECTGLSTLKFPKGGL